MLGLISSDWVVLALVGGIPVGIFAIGLIWAKPRKMALVRALVSVLIVGGMASGIWAALASSGGEPETARPAAAVPGSGGEEASGGGSSSGGAASCAPSGATIQITAHNIQFSTGCLAAPANTPFTINFDNQDSAVTHNIHILAADPATDADSTTLFTGPSVTGVAEAMYNVNALPAGTYFFHCDFHPTQMFGTFVVEGDG
jgi:plastocyanin